MSKIFYWFMENKFSFISVAFVGCVIWRFNKNFNEFEKAIKKEKIFDVRKANEQLKIYREIYDPDNDVEVNNRLLNAASIEDKAKIKKIFKKYDDMDQESLEKEINKLKEDIEMLEESKSTHQGIKLAKIYYGYEPSEDALKKIRQNYVENKKKIDGNL